MNERVDTVSRKTLKVPAALASIGGLLKIIFLIGFILVYNV